MPYFSVSMSESISREFVVCAPDRDSVEDILAAAIATDKFDNKKIILVRTNADSGLSVYDAKKSEFDAALKQSKVK